MAWVPVRFHHDDFAKAQVVHEAPEDQDQAVSHGGGEMEAFLETEDVVIVSVYRRCSNICLRIPQKNINQDSMECHKVVFDVAQVKRLDHR